MQDGRFVKFFFGITEFADLGLLLFDGEYRRSFDTVDEEIQKVTNGLAFVKIGCQMTRSYLG